MAERYSSAEGAFIMRHHATSIRALAVASKRPGDQGSFLIASPR
jgi:hypothetical protein